MRRRVVITGVGAVTPLGVGPEALFERWSRGETGISDGVGRCEGFEPTEFISSKEVKRSDRFTQLAIAAADGALDSSGWDTELPYPGEQIACLIGTGIGGLGSLEEQHATLLEGGPRRVSPYSVP